MRTHKQRGRHGHGGLKFQGWKKHIDVPPGHQQQAAPEAGLDQGDDLTRLIDDTKKPAGSSAGLCHRGARKVRQRLRRRVRSRVFNNARTATRNLDLPLAIGVPIAAQLFLLHRGILASAWRPQRRAFSGMRRYGQGSFCLQSGVRKLSGHDFGPTASSVFATSATY